MIAKMVSILLLSLFLSTSSLADEISQLVPFIVKVESNGNPYTVSTAGCIGLMQINPKGALAEWNKEVEKNREEERLIFRKYGHIEFWWIFYKPKDLFDIKINLKIGEWYLYRLKNHYIPKDKYSIELLLACYNAGPTKMRKLNWDISKAPKETKTYIKRVMALYDKSFGE